MHIRLGLQEGSSLALRRWHSLQGFEDLSTALRHGAHLESSEWCTRLSDQLERALEVCMTDEVLLRSYIPVSADAAQAATLTLRFARNLFNESVATLSVEGFQHVLYLVRECYWPLNEARRLGGHLLREAVDELEQSVFLQQCLAEAMQLRQTAMEALEEAIVQQEALEITAVWQCLDMLKAAALTAQQGRAVESEGHQEGHRPHLQRAPTGRRLSGTRGDSGHNKGCATQNNYGSPS